ncbi:unnamed protein product [Prorocentrum cordatum]|uniref:Uncharacterized protein n=1 Tax=Prorocentrum cordatum TaxID=2364126 RepID=A0ABN9W3X0_9DINO|nr:unnamed protein product [Polarella glacialis]
MPPPRASAAGGQGGGGPPAAACEGEGGDGARRPGPGHEPLEGAGAEGAADFESLLRLLRQECVRLCRENATLRVRAARSEQDVDGAADAVDGSPRGTDGLGGREPPPLKFGAGCQERPASPRRCSRRGRR